MESREGVDALFRYATEGILISNNVGEIIRINPSAERLFGYEHNELIGQRIEVLVPKSLSHRHVNYREKFHHSPHARSMGAGLDLFGLKKDGTEFPVEISLSPYKSGEIDYVIAFIVDVTLRRQAEEKMRNYSSELEKQVKNRTLILEEAIEELEKTKRDLHHALEKERDLNELKSRFVSMASHEFRTPLTTIMSSLSLVTKYGEMKDDTNQQRHVNKIRNSINNLTDILNDFLSVSKLEEGKVEVEPAEFNLKNFLEEIRSDFTATLGADQHLLIEYNGREIVSIDKKVLRNIMFNLVSNAIKFSPSNGVVKVNGEVSEKEILISVRDNGIGISPEDQKHLFERFFRGQNATHIQGTGLGLNIVASYAELLNAKIDFTSKVGFGTTFNIKIPRA